jgi:hypothetical protein
MDFRLSNLKWIKEIRCEELDCIDLARDTGKWLTFVNTVMNIRFT